MKLMCLFVLTLLVGCETRGAACYEEPAMHWCKAHDYTDPYPATPG